MTHIGWLNDSPSNKQDRTAPKRRVKKWTIEITIGEKERAEKRAWCDGIWISQIAGWDKCLHLTHSLESQRRCLWLISGNAFVYNDEYPFDWRGCLCTNCCLEVEMIFLLLYRSSCMIDATHIATDFERHKQHFPPNELFVLRHSNANVLNNENRRQMYPPVGRRSNMLHIYVSLCRPTIATNWIHGIHFLRQLVIVRYIDSWIHRIDAYGAPNLRLILMHHRAKGPRGTYHMYRRVDYFCHRHDWTT